MAPSKQARCGWSFHSLWGQRQGMLSVDVGMISVDIRTLVCIAGTRLPHPKRLPLSRSAGILTAAKVSRRPTRPVNSPGKKGLGCAVRSPPTLLYSSLAARLFRSFKLRFLPPRMLRAANTHRRARDTGHRSGLGTDQLGADPVPLRKQHFCG